jgi:hypothetical protein
MLKLVVLKVSLRLEKVNTIVGYHLQYSQHTSLSLSLNHKPIGLLVSHKTPRAKQQSVRANASYPRVLTCFRKSVACLFFSRHFQNKQKIVTGVELTESTIGMPQQ